MGSKDIPFKGLLLIFRHIFVFLLGQVVFYLACLHANHHPYILEKHEDGNEMHVVPHLVHYFEVVLFLCIYKSF
jgi:hypothetical protein